MLLLCCCVQIMLAKKLADPLKQLQVRRCRVCPHKDCKCVVCSPAVRVLLYAPKNNLYGPQCSSVGTPAAMAMTLKRK